MPTPSGWAIALWAFVLVIGMFELSVFFGVWTAGVWVVLWFGAAVLFEERLRAKWWRGVTQKQDDDALQSIIAAGRFRHIAILACIAAASILVFLGVWAIALFAVEQGQYGAQWATPMIRQTCMDLAETAAKIGRGWGSTVVTQCLTVVPESLWSIRDWPTDLLMPVVVFTGFFAIMGVGWLALLGVSAIYVVIRYGLLRRLSQWLKHREA